MKGNRSVYGVSNLDDNDDDDKMLMMMMERQSNFSIFSVGEDDPMEDEVIRILLILLYGIVFVACFSGQNC